MKRFAVILGLLLAAIAVPAPRAQQSSPLPADPGIVVLTPTRHPPVPRELSQLWLAPEHDTSAAALHAAQLSNVAKLVAGGDFTKALAAVSQPSLHQGPLAAYASYYTGVVQLKLKRFNDAQRSFKSVQEQKPVGYLSEAASLGEADASEGLDDPSAAVRIYERLLDGRSSNTEDALMRLGRAAKAAGDRTKAANAFTRVFYEFPLGESAAIAGSELNALTGLQPLAAGTQRYKVELGRAERLFGARQYADAKTVFQGLLPISGGDDRELLQLRIAESDYFLKRTASAREELRPLTEKAARKGEALFFYGLAMRDLDLQGFVTTLERVANEFPDQTWAEDALDNLATYYLKKSDDDQADALYRRLYALYPRGTYAEHAAWMAGWTSYRKDQYADTIRIFERAASDFPRSDYRPAWLYWTGRAHEQLGEAGLAQERYALTTADYLNSYYGRLAVKRIDQSAVARVVSLRSAADPAAPQMPALPPNGAVVRGLLQAELYDDALNELRYAQRMWGDSAAIEATMAWAQLQQSRTESGWRRFTLLRGAMTRMKQAYPQFLTAGGENLPPEILTVIFPIAYWESIKKHAEANGLDPYLVAALVAQESTFTADVKSYAGAYGLMQMLPGTARQYARKLQMTYSSRLLTDPEANIRMGTAYLADKIHEFGNTYMALASYNAGERPVHRWQSERPGMEVDEFIDDIPYPQTQNYVKRILGTADDYRRIYESQAKVDGADTTARPSTPQESVAKKAAPAPAPKKPAPRRPAPKKSAPKSETTS
jgi:soluble lytic murein transglycosylase